MDDGELERQGRTRGRKFRGALATVILGGTLAGLGFLFGQDRSGDEATQAGVMAGIGVGLLIGGLGFAWLTRPGDRRWQTESSMTKGDRLQAQRARQLWLFPLAMAAFLVPATLALRDIVAGEGGLADYLSASLPALYAWVVAAIALGWDRQSRTNRRYLEDELTLALRSRAVGAAFVVLMVGVTLALGVGLWKPAMGIAALPFVLAAAGATAGIRFAWLDREAGRDDG